MVVDRTFLGWKQLPFFQLGGLVFSGLVRLTGLGYCDKPAGEPSISFLRVYIPSINCVLRSTQALWSVDPSGQAQLRHTILIASHKSYHSRRIRCTQAIMFSNPRFKYVASPQKKSARDDLQKARFRNMARLGLHLVAINCTCSHSYTASTFVIYENLNGHIF